MSFRLVANSVTLDDLERGNSPNRRVIGQRIYFSNISFMAILAGNHPQREP